MREDPKLTASVQVIDMYVRTLRKYLVNLFDPSHTEQKYPKGKPWGMFVSVDQRGLEPPASSVQMRRSSQLSYWPECVVTCKRAFMYATNEGAENVVTDPCADARYLRSIPQVRTIIEIST